MASLTASERTLLNYDSPNMNDLLVGDRIRYLTTDGYYSSGTISGNAISSGSMNGVTVTSGSLAEVNEKGYAFSTPSGTTNTSTSPGIGPGMYFLSTISSGVTKMSSVAAVGDKWTFINKTTNTTAHLMGSSGGTGVMTFNGGTSFTHLLFENERILECICVSTNRFLITFPYSSAAFTSYSTTT